MEEILESQTMNRSTKKKSKKKVFLLVLLFVIICGAAFGIWKYMQVKEENKKEEYASTLAETSVDMHIEFLLSSLIVASYSDVWDSAIDDGRDFNVALTDFQDGLSDKGLLSEREKSQDKIRDNMKVLQDPPKEYMESYIVLKQMYGTYTKMVEQSISPTGSLIDFNRKTNDLASQFEQEQEQFDISMPADIKKLKEKIEKENEEESTEL